MRRFLVVMMLTVASLSWAEPKAVEARSARLIGLDGSEISVDEHGKYLNVEALDVVNKTIVDLETQNGDLRSILANVQVAPGMPQWATVLISTCLSIMTVVAGIFAAKELAK